MHITPQAAGHHIRLSIVKHDYIMQKGLRSLAQCIIVKTFPAVDQKQFVCLDPQFYHDSRKEFHVFHTDLVQTDDEFC